MIISGGSAELTASQTAATVAKWQEGLRTSPLLIAEDVVSYSRHFDREIEYSSFLRKVLGPQFTLSRFKKWVWAIETLGPECKGKIKEDAALWAAGKLPPERIREGMLALYKYKREACPDTLLTLRQVQRLINALLPARVRAAKGACANCVALQDEIERLQRLLAQ